MGHFVRLLIARESDLGDTFRQPPFLGAVEIADGIVATPLEDAVIDRLGDEETAAQRLDAAGRGLSRSGPVLFVESEYFGGAGGKEVAVWQNGDRTFAAWEGDNGLHWLRDFEGVEERLTALDDAAILAFDLNPEDTGDVFQMFGLDRWRRIEDVTRDVREARGYVPPLGVILAGGQATRMGGGDKGLLPLGESSILGHVIYRLRPQVAGLALNANGDPARFAEFGLPVLSDSVEGFAGPLAGVLAGLDWAADRGASHIVTAAADTPFFPADLVDGLEAAAREQGKPIALARTVDGRHPTFGLWPVALRDDLRMSLTGGMRKVLAWTDRHGTAFADFPTGNIDPFFNVNTPGDLDEARRLMGAG